MQLREVRKMRVVKNYELDELLDACFFYLFIFAKTSLKL